MRAFRHTLVPRDFNNHDTNPVSSFTRRTVVLMNVSHTLPQQALKCMSHRFLRVRTYACVRLVQDLQARGVAASVSSLVCPRRHSVVRQPSRPTVGGCHRVCKGRFSGWCRISSGVRRRRSPGCGVAESDYIRVRRLEALLQALCPRRRPPPPRPPREHLPGH